MKNTLYNSVSPIAMKNDDYIYYIVKPKSVLYDFKN